MESCFDVICTIIGWALIIAIALAIAPYIFPIILIIIIVVIISFIKELIKELNCPKEENHTNSNNDIKLLEEKLVEDEFDSELKNIDPGTYKSIFKTEKPVIDKTPLIEDSQNIDAETYKNIFKEDKPTDKNSDSEDEEE